MTCQNIGKPWRRPDDQRNKADQFRVLPQQREQSPAGAQSGQKAVECRKAGIGIFCAGQLIENDGREIDEIFPSLLAANGAIRAAAPILHGLDDFRRATKTHLCQSIEQFALAFGWLERQPTLRQQLGSSFEQPDVVPFDIAQMRHQHILKIVARVKPEKSRKHIECLGGCRKGMDLFVSHHLQAMFDGTQNIVSGGELIARLPIYPAVRCKRGERDESAALAQLGVAPAGNQLLGLNKEFNLANATSSKLDIVALDRDLAMTAIGVDLLLHFMDMGNRGVIEIFAPDERRQLMEKLFTGGKIAGTGTRLDQRRALPVLTAALVIVECRGGRNCNLRRRWVRPQPQINSEYVSIPGPGLQDLDKISGQADEERRRL